MKAYHITPFGLFSTLRVFWNVYWGNKRHEWWSHDEYPYTSGNHIGFYSKSKSTSRIDNMPFIFATSIDELSKPIWKNVIWCILFVDNVILLVEISVTNTKLEEWTMVLEGNELHISPTKIKYMICNFS